MSTNQEYKFWTNGIDWTRNPYRDFDKPYDYYDKGWLYDQLFPLKEKKIKTKRKKLNHEL